MGAGDEGRTTGASQDDTLLEALLESTADAIYAIDRDWRFTIFNRAAEAYFRTSRDAVIGRGLFELFPQGLGTPFETMCRQALEEAIPSTTEVPSSTRPDRTVEVRFVPISGRGLAVVLTDVTERVEAEARRRLLTREMNHRLKNSLATVQAIANQSFRGTGLEEAVLEQFRARIAALGRASDVLVEESWRKGALDAIAHQIAEPYGGSNSGRFSIDGPKVVLGTEAVVSVTLALHELATNAAKYGALSTSSGRVTLAWTLNSDALRLVWREEGGPQVAPPARTGFGDRLIRDGLGRMLKGEVRIDYPPEGLVCTVTAPRSALGED